MLKNQIMPDITDFFRPFRPDGRGLGLFGPFEECIKITEHLVLTLNRYCILELKLNYLFGTYWPSLIILTIDSNPSVEELLKCNAYVQTIHTLFGTPALEYSKRMETFQPIPSLAEISQLPPEKSLPMPKIFIGRTIRPPS